MKLLIADDDPSIAEALATSFPLPDFTIIPAYSAREALYLLPTMAPDVIVMEMTLPDLPGIELCKAIRAVSEAPILVISALDKPDTIIAALEAGADDYLVKPFTNNMIAAHVMKLTRRASTKPLTGKAFLSFSTNHP